MLSARYHYPKQITPQQLDHFLEDGWFRSGSLLYYSKLTITNGNLFAIVRTRLPLENYRFKKRMRKLWKKNEAIFRWEVQPMQINAAKEALYQLHRPRFEGYSPSSLNDYLFEDTPATFDTYEVNVYHKDTLVASSFFDAGAKSMASLLGLFHPDYSEYSLGIYTMLIEIQYGISTAKTHYYPGYILPNCPRFDYKKRVGHLEYFDWISNWHPISELQSEQLIAEQWKKQISDISALLTKHNIPHKRLLYPVYELEMPSFLGAFFMKSPIFLHCYPDENSSKKLLIIEYDFIKATYVLSQFSIFNRLRAMYNVGSLTDVYDVNIHFLDILKLENTIVKAVKAEDILSSLLDFQQKQILLA